MSKPTATTYQLRYEGTTTDVLVEERGEGRPFLLLHGGAGPATMARFAVLLAERKAKVMTPTHPGFARTKRPDELKSVRGLAQLYSTLLDRLDLDDVTVVGNSVGSWVAAELALLGNPKVGRAVLTGALGIDVPGHPIPDTSKLTIPEIMALSYYNPKPFLIDPSTLTDEQRAIGASNRVALQAYAPAMADPTLAGRLGKVTLPVLVISGESDRIADAEHGKAFAAAIPGAKFKLLPGTGHLPQVETPEVLLDTIWDFVQTGH